MRTVAAIALAPLAIVPVLAIAFGPWAVAHGGTRSLAGILLPALILAYPLVVLAGVPMHMALVRHRYTRVADYAVTGALLGAVPVIGYLLVAIAFEAKFTPREIPHATARNLEWGGIGVLVFAACSTAVAMAFRAIARAGRS